MYKKKEIFFVIFILFVLITIGYFINREEKEIDYIEKENKIIINVDGEIVRKTKLEFQQKTTYGTVFLKIKNLLNEYSDLSEFDLYKTINSSIDIYIPTIDKNNNYDKTAYICINTASQKELMLLPQIGEKRSLKILEYIKINGKIKTWDEFFEIVSVKDEYKTKIKKQAVL